ncbi:MAG: Error-prone repair protein ImuA, partial [Flavisolibacter sp.]
MGSSKNDIIRQLRQDILLMQGFKPASSDIEDKTGLGFISDAFPNSRFPTAAIHEFFCSGVEEVSASSAFISGIVSSFMKKGGIALWIASSQMIFPPALKLFGIDPDKVIFLHL